MIPNIDVNDLLSTDGQRWSIAFETRLSVLEALLPFKCSKKNIENVQNQYNAGSNVI